MFASQRGRPPQRPQPRSLPVVAGDDGCPGVNNGLQCRNPRPAGWGRPQTSLLRCRLRHLLYRARLWIVSRHGYLTFTLSRAQIVSFTQPRATIASAYCFLVSALSHPQMSAGPPDSTTKSTSNIPLSTLRVNFGFLIVGLR